MNLPYILSKNDAYRYLFGPLPTILLLHIHSVLNPSTTTILQDLVPTNIETKIALYIALGVYLWITWLLIANLDQKFTKLRDRIKGKTKINKDAFNGTILLGTLLPIIIILYEAICSKNISAAGIPIALALPILAGTFWELKELHQKPNNKQPRTKPPARHTRIAKQPKGIKRRPPAGTPHRPAGNQE